MGYYISHYYIQFSNFPICSCRSMGFNLRTPQLYFGHKSMPQQLWIVKTTRRIKNSLSNTKCKFRWNCRNYNNWPNIIDNVWKNGNRSSQSKISHDLIICWFLLLIRYFGGSHTWLYLLNQLWKSTHDKVIWDF